MFGWRYKLSPPPCAQLKAHRLMVTVRESSLGKINKLVK